MKLKITPFLGSPEFSVELEDFEPKGGYEPFLRDICGYLGETFINWYQGVESGVGAITYQGSTVKVFWTDFPFALSFDCRNNEIAEQLYERLQAYFSDKDSNHLNSGSA